MIACRDYYAFWEAARIFDLLAGNSVFASEILLALLAFWFETLSLNRLYGKCDELNLASAHVMKKCGLQYEGTIREHVWLRDHWRSTWYFGMLAGE